MLVGPVDLAVANLVCKDPQNVCDFHGFYKYKYGVNIEKVVNCGTCTIYLVPVLFTISAILEILRFVVAIHREMKKNRRIAPASLTCQNPGPDQAQTTNIPSGLNSNQLSATSEPARNTQEQPLNILDLSVRQLELEEDSNHEKDLEQVNHAITNEDIIPVPDADTDGVMISSIANPGASLPTQGIVEGTIRLNLQEISGFQQIRDSIKSMLFRPASFTLCMIVIIAIAFAGVFYIKDQETLDMGGFVFIETLSIINRTFGLFLPVFLVLSENKITEYTRQKIQILFRYRQ